MDTVKDSAGFRDFWRFVDKFYNSRPEMLKDVVLKVNIDLFELMRGTKMTLSYNRTVECERCKGTKREPNTPKVPCGVCQGKGSFKIHTGNLNRRIECASCNGTGEIIEKPCSACRSSGTKNVMERVELDLSSSPERVHLKGKGNKVQNTTGDLYILVNLPPMYGYTRKGLDIHSNIHISFPQAVLKVEQEVNTLFGKTTLKLPENLVDGTEIRVKQHVKL